MNTPKFIVLEGIDGSGKSTQARLLAQRLSDEGQKVYLTAEPTSATIGSLIRKIFRGEEKAHHKTIAALYAADRLEHILNETDGLLKMRSEGFTIICDRYYFSSYAYHAAHMPMEWVIEINKLAAQMLSPDVHLFFNIEPHAALSRIHKNRTTTELYENIDTLQKVYDNYFAAFNLLNKTENIQILNADIPEKELSDKVFEIIQTI